MGFTEDVSLTLYNPLVNCPSSYHGTSGRHSPILPSTHVAHKITQREKHLQFQAYKRKQQFEKEYCGHSASKPSHFVCSTEGESHDNERLIKHIKIEPGGNLTLQSDIIPPNVPFINNRQERVEQKLFYKEGIPRSDGSVFQFYPNNIRPYPFHNFTDANNLLAHNNGMCSPGGRVYDLPTNGTIHNQFLPHDHYQNGVRVRAPFDVNNCPEINNQNGIRMSTANIRPRTNITVSMQYGFDPSLDINVNNEKARHSRQPVRDVSGHNAVGSSNGGQYFAYDIEASIHMKIVDNSRARNNKPDLDLPSIGSFLDYLNDP